MGRRSYNQNCVLARAGDVIGERWTILLVRDLLIAPRRFGTLLDSLKGIGTNLLSARLKDLQDAGIVERREDEDGPSRYALTDRGRALEPSILALIRWSMIHGPENQPGSLHRPDWDLLALKALFQPDLADDLTVCVQFRAQDFEGWVRIADRQMNIGVGSDVDADVTVDGTIADLFLGSDNPQELVINGKPASLQQFVSAFAR